MENIDWLKMLEYKQALSHLSRELLTQNQEKTLTASELEILSILYLYPEESTPLELSRKSGMKKEAVSRCLKQLFNKDCITKEKHPSDERSYLLSLTQTGNDKLKENYSIILKPLYDLQRQLGGDFKTLFELIISANKSIEKN